LTTYLHGIKLKIETFDGILDYKDECIQVIQAQDTTFYQRLYRQLPSHNTNSCRPVPRIPSLRLTLLGVLAVILTLRHLNQFFDE